MLDDTASGKGSATDAEKMLAAYRIAVKEAWLTLLKLPEHERRRFQLSGVELGGGSGARQSTLAVINGFGK